MKNKLKSDAREMYLACSLGEWTRRENNRRNVLFCRLLKSWTRGLWGRGWVIHPALLTTRSERRAAKSPGCLNQDRDKEAPERLALVSK